MTKLCEFVANNQLPSVVHLPSLSGSLDAVLISALYQKTNDLQLIIVENRQGAEELLGDLIQLLPNQKILLFPCPDPEQKYDQANLGDISEQRIAVIHALGQPLHLKQELAIIVTYMDALLTKVAAKVNDDAHGFGLSIKQSVSRETLIDLFRQHQFKQVDFVYERGQFALRGGIVDVYAPETPLPYRIELWDQHISSLRHFDPESQKSLKELSEIFIPSHGMSPKKSISWTSLITHLPNKSTIWIKGTATITKPFEEPTISASKNGNLSIHTLQSHLASFLHIIWGNDSAHIEPTEPCLPYDNQPQPHFQKKFQNLYHDLATQASKQYTLVIACPTEGQVSRINAMLQQYGNSAIFFPLQASFRGGYIDHTSKIVCYTDHEIFHRYHRQNFPTIPPKKESILLEEARNLNTGDYIVHIDHGIGRFAGLHKLCINGKDEEVVRLIYKNDDTVLLHVHELHKISKYTSKNSDAPLMSKLGTSSWKNKKSKIKREIKNIAKELISLYTARKQATGFAFPAETAYDIGLAISFPYEETVDQRSALADVKSDMEKNSPMDRLICGDVGFGKTEIAIRAAFKAAQAGKQVAILVPTTILALQHYNSFVDRLGQFPVYIDYLNRFKTKQETQKTIADAASGKLDILIGTHKLLSNQVKFNSLGLLIIDEEQKFGVSAKEKLRQLRVNVDTLTLTATPIPRTLHFSLMGARDLSILHTPPTNRRPIKTILEPLNFNQIKKAIQEEMQRNGQVFFVHNSVHNIYNMAKQLEVILPMARICIAHGQMKGVDLEEVLLKFIARKYDVLVSTSIIESGIDISNVNTIIINNSHLLGLSDLHQMRGRVGRSNRQAFCYLLIPSEGQLTQEAKLRLKTLQTYTKLGEGFNIAMSDLDIRGSGDLLGASQSGFIADVGIQTYTQILKEAVHEVKSEDFEQLFPEGLNQEINLEHISIETDYPALLPDTYITQQTHRMLWYTRLNHLANLEQLKQLKADLIDQFGPLPEVAQALLNIIAMRWIAQKMGFHKLGLYKDILQCYMEGGFQKKYPKIWNNVFKYVQRHPNHCSFKEISNQLVLHIQSVPTPERVLEILNCMLDSKST